MSESHYFQPSKRGELHELKEELHSSNKDKKKDAVKRVIAAMTVGKDVSSLFPDVVNCMQTNNIELKKLVYLYVINYAKVQPELAILAVNTFRKDSLDPNPLIRALALRTMGYIRLEAIAEYLVEPLRRCCADADPYVRKTAAICIAKLYDIRADMVEAEQLLDALRKMFGDSNPVVVSNAVAALAEISDASGTNLLKQYFAEDESSVTKLLTALNECTEWGQVFVLDALINFEPSTSRAAESMIDRVTARLSHANAAVVLSAVKVIMKLLEKVTNPDVVSAVHRKLCPPLVTLLSAEPELQYVALRNIELIVRRRPTILANEVKMFFCKFNDPLYIKIEKLDVLVGLATERNLDCVLAELREYANDVDHEMARRSIRCLGRLSMRLPGAVGRCIQLLLEFLSNKAAYAVQECAVVLRDIFRKYPADYESVVPPLCDCIDLMDEPEARASIVWIIGQYSEYVPDASALLATFISSFLEEVGSVQLQILTAAVKLFMLQPKQNQQLVTQLLKRATEEAENPDVRDRAYIYWRMLSRNPEATRKIVFATKPTMNAETDSIDNQTLATLIENISMVASVYHKLPATFTTRVRPAAMLRSVNLRAGAALRSQTSEEDSGQMAVERARREIEKQQQQRRSARSSSSSRSRSDASNSDSSSDEGPVDLLDLSDSSPAAASSGCPIQQTLVLAADAPGSHQQRGLELRAALHKPEGGTLQLYLTATNRTASPLSGFAVQFNKNSFGLAPGAPLNLPTIAPGAAAETTLPVVPNQLNSNTPPTLPLVLQMAVKCSLDIFYFSVPYSVSDVLEDRGPIHKELFRQQWQALGEAKQAAFMGMAQRPLGAQETTRLLKPKRVNLVAQRAAESYDALYYSAVTTNNLLVLLEISLQKGAQGVKVAIRTDAAALVNLFQQLMVSTLHITL